MGFKDIFKKGFLTSYANTEITIRYAVLAMLVCLVIGPFDALYLYIRAGRRRDEIRRREKQEGQKREEGK